MSRLVPIDWRTIKSALRKWAGDSTGLETVWGNQGAPQPSWPYISLLKLPSPTAIGALDEEQWLSDGGLQIVGQREFGLSVQVHVGPPQVGPSSDPDCDAEAVAYQALAALSLPATDLEFKAAGLALRDRGTPQPVDELVGAKWVPRSVFEIRLGIVSVLNPSTAPGLDAVGYFDKATVSSTVTGLVHPGGPLDLDDEPIDPANP